MTTTTIMAGAAGLLTVLFVLYTAVKNGRSMKYGWVIPALLSLTFFVFSVSAIINEGPTGFWTEHTRNLWGNQIWFDLLLAAGIGWYLIVPQAKALGMRILPWGLIVIGTGCIGFTAMLARMLYLKENSAR